MLQLPLSIPWTTGLVAVSTTWYLKWIHKSVRRTPFSKNICNILVSTSSDLFGRWESIPHKLQKKILAIHTDRINAMNGRDSNAPAATWWDPQTAINGEDMELLMYLLCISLMVYYWNTVDGKLTNFIPHINGSKITIRMAIGEIHI
jgi:hypothetical protein